MRIVTVDNGVRGARVTRAAGMVALSLAALLLVSPAIASADDPTPESNISVTQVDSSTQDMCLPGALVLSYSKSNTAEYFELVVKASAPPCEPIDAKAVIYAMPGGGEAWPQTLVEVVPFRISKAGRTTIRFTKTCEPMQFDVITGAAPSEIAPWGEWHGPLLFPLDTETTLQHWGWDCNEPTTTTTTEPDESTTTTTEPGEATTTTEPDESTTTTTEPDESTTTTEPDESTTTTVPVDVGGETEERDPGTPSGPGSGADTEVGGVTADRGTGGSNLAYTGSDTNGPVAVGLVLALSGVMLLLVSRRRGPVHS